MKSEVKNMDQQKHIRELLQVFFRRFGLLNANCCENCCGEEVSLVQSHILWEVKRREKPSMQQVAEALGIDITTFSRQIKTLENKTLIRKTTDPNDRRVSLLSLTPRGEELENKISTLMQEYIKKIFAHMTDFERDVVISSIRLLSEAIGKAGSCC
jgi:DNA-binding MarR family transcriptional regulator